MFDKLPYDCSGLGEATAAGGGGGRRSGSVGAVEVGETASKKKIKEVEPWQVDRSDGSWRS